MLYNPQLETFLCVVESGSFSKAAEKLFITAPAVIKQINSLESSLNLQLFDRTHRGLIVTEAGKSIYKDAKYIIQYSKEALLRAENTMGGDKEIIRVGISPMTPPQIFSSLFPKIQEHHPEINIVDFDIYNVETFNRCENSNDVLLAIKSWESVHPLMKLIPVNWNYGIPFGLLYSPEPSKKVKKVLNAIEKTREL